MPPSFKKYGQIILALIGAVAIISMALFTKGTEYENAWFYAFGIWFILYSAFEVYLKRK